MRIAPKGYVDGMVLYKARISLEALTIVARSSMLRHVFLSSSRCVLWFALGFWGAAPVPAAASSAMTDSCYRLPLDTVAVHETADLLLLLGSYSLSCEDILSSGPE